MNKHLLSLERSIELSPKSQDSKFTLLSKFKMLCINNNLDYELYNLEESPVRVALGNFSQYAGPKDVLECCGTDWFASQGKCIIFTTDLTTKVVTLLDLKDGSVLNTFKVALKNTVNINSKLYMKYDAIQELVYIIVHNTVLQTYEVSSIDVAQGISRSIYTGSLKHINLVKLSEGVLFVGCQNQQSSLFEIRCFYKGITCQLQSRLKTNDLIVDIGLVKLGMTTKMFMFFNKQLGSTSGMYLSDVAIMEMFQHKASHQSSSADELRLQSEVMSIGVLEKDLHRIPILSQKRQNKDIFLGDITFDLATKCFNAQGWLGIYQIEVTLNEVSKITMRIASFYPFDYASEHLVSSKSDDGFLLVKETDDLMPNIVKMKLFYQADKKVMYMWLFDQCGLSESLNTASMMEILNHLL